MCSPRPKNEVNRNILLRASFESNGVVHREFLPQSHTINCLYNLEVAR